MALYRCGAPPDHVPPLAGRDSFVRVGPEPLALPTAEIHVFRVVTDVPSPWVASLRATLSIEEEERARRFALECDRRGFIVRRAQLRAILGRYLGIAPTEVPLAVTRHGRPMIQGPCHDHDLRFTVSRADGLALIAVARHDDVGIDVERVRPFPDALGVARFFSAEERRVVESLPPSDVDTAFFGYWTRKEAVVKSLGLGLSLRLDSFTLSAAPRYAPERVLLEDRVAPIVWLVPVPPPLHGYMAALAVTRAPRPIRCFAWPAPGGCPP